MQSCEQYTLYRLAHELVANKGYEVIYTNEKQEEFWLEKQQSNGV